MTDLGDPVASGGPGEAVVSVLRALVPGATEVGCPQRLTGGASRETWRCDVDGVAHVVQRQRADAERDMQVEAAVLQAAAANGVMVPPFVGCVDAPGGATSLVTRHVPGETIARKILRDPGFGNARAALVEQLAQAAARIHGIDIASTTGLEPVDPLASARERLDELGEPHPTFELALRWLDDHRPPALPTTVVHGDFRLGNVIVDGDGLAAVIDWELAHLGDPMEDLGWLCVPAWRFGSTLPAAGVGGRDALLAAYADEAGVAVDPATLRWWEICGILRWGVICIAQADAHRSGAVRSHELAAIGRRVCETEHDLFLALAGRW